MIVVIILHLLCFSYVKGYFNDIEGRPIYLSWNCLGVFGLVFFIMLSARRG